MRIGMIDCQAIRKRWEAVGSKLDERGRRVFAAGEVRAAGWGGPEAVSEITGLARSTIGRGLKDLDAAPLPKGRVRRGGGGRRALSSRPRSGVPSGRCYGSRRATTSWLSPCRDGSQDQRQQRAQTVAGAR